MKKGFFTSFLALMAAMTLSAQSFTGDIIVNRNGQTNTATVTVTVTQQADGLNTLVLQVPLFGTMTMTDVPAATTGGITTYSAVRDVATNFGAMRTTLFARTVDGMMAADVAIPAQNTTMWFNTVGNHFQLPNSDLEDWSSNYENEPNRWHGFKSATGMFSYFAPALLGKSEDVHSGATGQYSAVVTAKSAGTSIANGTMTSGRLNAASMSATSTSNHASTDQAYGDDFYIPLFAKPDQFKVWLKYTQETANASNKANVSLKTFDGSYYQEPVDKTYTNLSGSIVGGEISACDWTQFTFPMDYDSYAANNAESNAIFVTFSTNANPGEGSSNDMLYIDDMELVYLGNMTNLSYNGTTIAGWQPAVTEYNIEVASAPSLDDFTASIEGVSAVLTKSMEQNADGSYRIVVSVVSADLQTATAYVINATIAEAIVPGDVDGNGIVNISDVTAFISYLLNGNNTINERNADIDGNGKLNITDATMLITMAMNN